MLNRSVSIQEMVQRFANTGPVLLLCYITAGTAYG